MKSAIISAVVLLLCGQALGAVVLNDATTSVRPGVRMEYLEDPVRGLGIRDVTEGTAASRFKPLPSAVPNFGFTRSAVWLRFDLENRSTRNEDWILEVDFAMIDRIDVFVPAGNGSYRMIPGGESAVPVEMGAALMPFFPLTVPRGETSRIFIRYYDEGAVVLPVTIWEPGARRDNISRMHGLIGIQYGIILALIIYNLFLFFSVLDRAYLYYVLFTAAMFLIILTKDGLVLKTLLVGTASDTAPWVINRFLALMQQAGMIFFIQFTRVFLDTRKNTGRIDNALRSLIILLALSYPLFFIIDYAVAGIITNLELVISMALIVIAAFTGFKRGFRPARFFILALVTFLAGIFMYVLKQMDVIPSNLFSEYVVHLGFVLQFVIFSLAVDAQTAGAVPSRGGSRGPWLPRARIKAPPARIPGEALLDRSGRPRSAGDEIPRRTIVKYLN